MEQLMPYEYTVFSPTHLALGPKGAEHADSPCGLVSMWNRGVKYDRDPARVSCKRCLRWIRKNAQPKDVTP